MKRTACAFLAIMFLFAFTAVGFAVAAETPVAEEKPVLANKVGEMVPDFTMMDPIAKKDVNYMKDIKGKGIHALVFMNTGCSACLGELMVVDKVAKEMGEKIKVYAIAVDMRGEMVIKTYESDYKFNMSYLMDPKFTLPPKFGFAYTPALVMADKDGKIIYLHGGFDPNTDTTALYKDIKGLLK